MGRKNKKGFQELWCQILGSKAVSATGIKGASEPGLADHVLCLHTRRHRPRYKVVLRRKLKLRVALVMWAHVPLS